MFIVQIATPVAQPPPGTYGGSVTVTLSTVTPGAIVRYGINEFLWTQPFSPIHPIVLTDTATIFVQAFGNDMQPSEPVSEYLQSRVANVFRFG